MIARNETGRYQALPALTLAVLLAGCSSGDSGEAHETNLTPFSFLAGTYGVEVSPTSATCEGEAYFPQEAWTVTNYLASLAVLPVPVTSSGPLPVNGGSPQNQASQQALPSSYAGLVGSTLHWSASLEQYATTEQGCLDRLTTVLDVQFAPDGHFTGTRSIFHEFAGGVDCPADCRVHFDVKGTKRAQ